MTADQPWMLPLRVHPETQYIVIDADGNQVADCWPPGVEFDPNPKRRTASLREAEARADEIVRCVNGYHVLLSLDNARGAATVGVEE